MELLHVGGHLWIVGGHSALLGLLLLLLLGMVGLHLLGGSDGGGEIGEMLFKLVVCRRRLGGITSKSVLGGFIFNFTAVGFSLVEECLQRCIRLIRLLLELDVLLLVGIGT